MKVNLPAHETFFFFLLAVGSQSIICPVASCNLSGKFSFKKQNITCLLFYFFLIIFCTSVINTDTELVFGFTLHYVVLDVQTVSAFSCSTDYHVYPQIRESCPHVQGCEGGGRDE